MREVGRRRHHSYLRRSYCRVTEAASALRALVDSLQQSLETLPNKIPLYFDSWHGWPSVGGSLALIVLIGQMIFLQSFPAHVSIGNNTTENLSALSRPILT